MGLWMWGVLAGSSLVRESLGFVWFVVLWGLKVLLHKLPTQAICARMGHTPSTAGTFRKKFHKNFGKTPETLSERFLEFPSRVRLGSPKPYSSRHFRLPEHFQNSLPPQYGWGRLFSQNWFRRGPLRAGHGIPSSTGGISDFCLDIVTDIPKCGSLMSQEYSAQTLFL